MTQHVFSVYDAKAESYLPPFTASTPGLAERIFTDMVNTDGHQFNRHPEDYTLYRIGTFDNGNAELAQAGHSVIVSGLQVLERESEPMPWESGN